MISAAWHRLQFESRLTRHDRSFFSGLRNHSVISITYVFPVLFCPANQFSLPSQSGKGIWLHPDIRRFESVRERQSKDQTCKRIREARAAADNRVAGGAVPPACTNTD